MNKTNAVESALNMIKSVCAEREHKVCSQMVQNMHDESMRRRSEDAYR